MFKLVKRHLKNNKGLTLIELLAVVVILGIIAAIAIPSIGGLIDNTKKDAHVANATQMINAAKTQVASNQGLTWSATGTTTVTLSDLVTNGLIENFEDPDTGEVGANGYDNSGSKVDIAKSGTTYTYEVTLVGQERSITSKEATELNRDAVVDN